MRRRPALAQPSNVSSEQDIDGIDAEVFFRASLRPVLLALHPRR